MDVISIIYTPEFYVVYIGLILYHLREQFVSHNVNYGLQEVSDPQNDGFPHI